HAQRGAVGEVGADHGCERAGEQQPLEAELDDARPLGDAASEGRQRVGHGDAHHRGEEAERQQDHPGSRGPAWPDRAGVDSAAAAGPLAAAAAAAAAMMRRACNTSMISLGHAALTTSAPCASVPNSRAAAMSANGPWPPSTATAMPTKP